MMSVSRMIYPGLGLLILLTVVGLSMPSAFQCRQYLYWGKTVVYADNVPTCYSRVVGAMTSHGVSGIKKSDQEVTGTKGNTYAAVTCIGTLPRATAVVMVVGNNDAETSKVRNELRDAIAKTQGL